MMELARVNDHLSAKLFFEEFNIPYEVISRGENKGKLRVKQIREKDRQKIYQAMDRLKQYGLEAVCDHINVFRDKDDRTVVTFSPYGINSKPAGIAWLEMSDHSIYGNWTKTFVVR